MTLQTISFATDVSWRPRKHLEAGLSTGPTVNISSSSTDLATLVVREDGALFASFHDHQDKTQVYLGWHLLATARCDLTHDGRWFIEARGGYEWMQPIKLGIGLQTALINASSWHAGLGLGHRFGFGAVVPAIRVEHRH